MIRRNAEGKKSIPIFSKLKYFCYQGKILVKYLL